MEFAPKSIFTGKSSDGSDYRVEEWSTDSPANLNLDIAPLAASMVLFIIASPILLITSLLNYKTNTLTINIIGLVLGSYIAYDFYHDWIVNAFFNIFLGEEILGFIATSNMVSVIVHVFMILSAVILNKQISEKTFKILLCISIVIGLMVGMIMGGNHGTFDNTKRVETNPNEDYMVRDKVTPESIAKDKDNQERYSNCN